MGTTGKEKKSGIGKVSAGKLKKTKPIKEKSEKKKKDQAPREKKNKSGKSFGISLKTQLIIGFVVPICIVVLVGVYAYNKAGEGMLNKYEEATSQSIKVTSDLLNYGFKTLTSEAQQLCNDADVKMYSSDSYLMAAYNRNIMVKSIYSNIVNKQVTNPFISSLYIINGPDLISPATTSDYQTVPSQYNLLIEKYGDRIRSSDESERWISTHDEIDVAFKVMPSTYIMSLYRDLDSKKACVVIDVDVKRIREVIAELSLGEGSIISFVTADGRELNSKEDGTFTFTDKEYYQKVRNDKETNYMDYVSVDGDDCLFMYSRCGINNSAICALVPKDILMVEANSLKNMVIIMILIACLVVVVIGFLIVRGITRNMGTITNRLSKVSTGDLTVSINIAGNTEFGILSKHIMETVTNTKKLIGDVQKVTDNVSTSAGTASGAAEVLMSTSQKIFDATDEISAGTNQQVHDAENCLCKMDSLSDKILKTDDRVVEMSKAVEDSKNMVNKGTEVIGTLNRQAELTGEATEQLSKKIENLMQQSKEIEYFVNVINTISEETTLLSLNASIEAARAGDAGRGFAVVAEQIKKLADSSLTASEEVDKVVQGILGMTKDTMMYSAQAKDNVEQQSKTVAETMEIFNNIYRSIQALTNNINEVNRNMELMNEDRHDTLQALESISAVTEETAASTASVGEGIKEQVNQVNTLNKIIEELKTLTEKLQSTISQFTV